MGEQHLAVRVKRSCELAKRERYSTKQRNPDVLPRLSARAAADHEVRAQGAPLQTAAWQPVAASVWWLSEKKSLTLYV